MVLDSGDVVLPVTDGDTIWTSSDPDLVDSADRAYEAVWSTPAGRPEGEEPPLTPRMVEIAGCSPTARRTA